MNTRKTVNLGSEATFKNALPELVGNHTKFVLPSGVVTLEGAVEALDTMAANAKTTADAKAQYRAAVAKEREYRALKGQMLKELRAQLIATYPPEKLEACGLAPKKKARVLTPDEKQARTVTMRDTRKANGTMGEAQKRADKAQAKLRDAYGADTQAEPDDTSHASTVTSGVANGVTNGAANGIAKSAPS
jgi:hypothetical protein